MTVILAKQEKAESQIEYNHVHAPNMSAVPAQHMRIDALDRTKVAAVGGFSALEEAALRLAPLAREIIEWNRGCEDEDGAIYDDDVRISETEIAETAVTLALRIFECCAETLAVPDSTENETKFTPEAANA